jgi:hypothetical protein
LSTGSGIPRQAKAIIWYNGGTDIRYFSTAYDNCEGGGYRQHVSGLVDADMGTSGSTCFGAWCHFENFVVGSSSGAGKWHSTIYLSNGTIDALWRDNITTQSRGTPNQITLGGAYYDMCASSNTATLDVDDVVIDTTPARVLLCTGSSFSARGSCDYQPATAWSAASITASAKTGKFAPDSTAYIYVFDATDAANSSGYPVTIGSGGTTYTVTPSASANGSISPSTPQTVSSGGTIGFTVTPNGGYTASVGGTCGGSLVGTTYTTSAITANCTVVATFTALPSYTVSTSAGANGSITPTSRTVTSGSTTTFTVTPNSGYTASASGCGGSLSGTTYTTGVISANCTVTATFSALDTTPPVISSPLPAGVQPYGTTSVTLQVTTNENATCKYNISDAAYASMSSTFASTGGTTHQQVLATANGTAYTRYVRCIDGFGNANSVSSVITFTVASDSTPPVTTINTSDPSTTLTNNLVVAGISSDNVAIIGCKWRVGSAPNASNGTACSGTTSFSCNTNTYAFGANTLYVGCYDSMGNYGSDSMVVNYIKFLPIPSNLRILTQ